jgi:hypothetical protein
MMINRGVVIVRPKAPFIEWLRGLPDPEMEATLEGLRADSNVYLISAYDSEKQRSSILKRVYARIFDEELLGWWTDESAYPHRRTLALFLEWFDVGFHEAAYDLGDDAIEII